MDKPNVVVVGYGFAGRCFHAYLVGLAVTPQSVRAVMAVIQAAQKSASTGEAITLKEISGA